MIITLVLENKLKVILDRLKDNICFSKQPRCVQDVHIIAFYIFKKKKKQS